MEKFKGKIRRRLLWLSMTAICIALINFLLLFNQKNLPNMPDFIRGFQSGMFCGLTLILIYFLVKYLRDIQNEKTLKKLYIEENDERRIMIMQKTGSVGMTICNIGLAIATVVAGHFNQVVFFSLMGATLFTVLVKGFLKIYYRYKF